jgi:hypothetical protein
MRVVVNNKNKKSYELLGEYLYKKWTGRLPGAALSKGAAAVCGKRRNADVDGMGPNESDRQVRNFRSN